MALIAITKLKLLRKELSAANPVAVNLPDTLAGHFDFSIRYPHVLKSLQETATVLCKAVEKNQPFQELTGYDDYIKASSRFVNGINRDKVKSNGRLVIPPTKNVFDVDEPLKMEHEIWRDRLEVAQRKRQLLYYAITPSMPHSIAFSWGMHLKQFHRSITPRYHRNFLMKQLNGWLLSMGLSELAINL